VNPLTPGTPYISQFLLQNILVSVIKNRIFAKETELNIFIFGRVIFFASLHKKMSTTQSILGPKAAACAVQGKGLKGLKIVKPCV